MIRQSESVAKLAAAIVAAQATMHNAPKETKGQVGNQIRYYTDLPTLTDLVRPILAANGLAFVQLPSGGGNGTVSLTTRLFHVSGEWIEDDYAMPAGQGAQGVGSALSYSRRYALMALLGIAADDDDGAAATTPRAGRKRAAEPTAASGGPQASGKPSEAQMRKMMACFNEAGISDRAARLAFTSAVVDRDVDTAKDLTRDEAAQLIDVLEQRIKDQDPPPT